MIKAIDIEMKNLIRTRLFFLVFFLAIFTGISKAQISSTEIDLLVEGALLKFNVAGMGLAIVKDGKVLHSKGYGVSSVITKQKVNEHTKFAIASNTKAFTTASLAILVEEGKMKWEDPVVKYIPEFKMYNDYVTQNFTIVDLLTHRSGLGLGAGDLMFFPDGSDFSMKDIISCFQYFEPQSAFRTKFDYDNLLYMVAGEVIARITGKSWGEFVENRIFAPLEMKDTYSSFTKIKEKSNLAIPHSSDSGELRAIDNFVFDPELINGAAGDIISSVHDIAKWMMVHLNSGKYGIDLKDQLFTPESHYKMWQVQTVVNHSLNPRYNAHFAGYGLGWFLTDMNGNLSVSHTGGLPGMLSKTIMIPDLNLGIVLLTNTSESGGVLFESVTRTIVDSYLGLDDFGWVDKFHENFLEYQSMGDSVSNAVWNTVKEANSDHIKKEDYIGIYEDKWFGKVEVFMKDEKLWMKALRSPKLNGEMQYYNANSFAIKWEFQDMNADAFAMFYLDENGLAQSIKMKGISPNIDFSFDFQDLDLHRIAE